jgi:hypothetical protein
MGRSLLVNLGQHELERTTRPKHDGQGVIVIAEVSTRRTDPRIGIHPHPHLRDVYANSTSTINEFLTSIKPYMTTQRQVRVYCSLLCVNSCPRFELLLAESSFKLI